MFHRLVGTYKRVEYGWGLQCTPEFLATECASFDAETPTVLDSVRTGQSVIAVTEPKTTSENKRAIAGCRDYDSAGEYTLGAEFRVLSPEFWGNSTMLEGKKRLSATVLLLFRTPVLFGHFLSHEGAEGSYLLYPFGLIVYGICQASAHLDRNSPILRLSHSVSEDPPVAFRRRRRVRKCELPVLAPSFPKFQSRERCGRFPHARYKSSATRCASRYRLGTEAWKNRKSLF